VPDPATIGTCTPLTVGPTGRADTGEAVVNGARIRVGAGKCCSTEQRTQISSTRRRVFSVVRLVMLLLTVNCTELAGLEVLTSVTMEVAVELALSIRPLKTCVADPHGYLQGRAVAVNIDVADTAMHKAGVDGGVVGGAVAGRGCGERSRYWPRRSDRHAPLVRSDRLDVLVAVKAVTCTSLQIGTATTGQQGDTSKTGLAGGVADLRSQIVEFLLGIQTLSGSEAYR
jgi:hypothetical protein